MSGCIPQRQILKYGIMCKCFNKELLPENPVREHGSQRQNEESQMRVSFWTSA